MFLQGTEADCYILTHLYGNTGRVANAMGDTVNESVILADIMDESFRDGLMNHSWLD